VGRISLRIAGVLTAALLGCAASASAGPPQVSSAAAAKSCSPVVNPYPGTRYEGVNLSHIRAVGIGCAKARKVAKGAHKKALGITPPPDGIRRYGWHRWAVTGNLLPASDKYQATRGSKLVRWRF
jgi:hypothetical protein